MDRYILTPKARRRRKIVTDVESFLTAAGGALCYAVTGRKIIKDVDVAAIANALDVTPNVLFGLDSGKGA